MLAAHIRYAWCSETALAAMLGGSASFTALDELFDASEPILAHIDARPPACAAALQLAAWARRPTFDRRPPPRLLRAANSWAQEHHRDDVRALASWVTGVLAEFDNKPDAAPADDAARLTFLHALAASDFPVLLLWSNPTLARHLFSSTENGRVALRVAAVASAKRLRRAALTAAAYACGSMRRFAPRDAWIGVAFARQDPSDERAPTLNDEPTTLTHIDRRSEQITVEPDLAWTARCWTELPAHELTSGITAWRHVRARVADAPDSAVRERYSRLLESLSDACRRMYRQWLNFAAVDAFLTRTDALFEETVEPETWRRNPHRWWVVRYIEQELVLTSGAARALQRSVDCSYSHARQAALQRGLAQPGHVAEPDAMITAQPPRMPLALRIAAHAPHAVLAQAEEPTDWIVDAAAAANVPRSMMPQDPSAHSARVIDCVAGGQRFVYAEPNPRRVAERFLMLPGLADDKRVAYAAATGGLAALAPPRELIDNRLVRVPAREFAASSVRPGAMVGFRSALVTAETLPLLSLELASEAYRLSPEPLPYAFDTQQAVCASFGRVDRDARIWLLTVDDLRKLSVAVPHARDIAAYFRLEIFELLGRPAWIEGLIDGKRSAWPTTTGVAFDILANAARVPHASVAILAPATTNGPLVRDGLGDPVPAQLYLVGRPE